MEIQIGLDFVQISRIREVFNRYGERFLTRIFTEEERRVCFRRRDPVPCLAGRFSAKEAVMKALGTGARQGVNFSQIEIGKEPSGKPVVILRGKAKDVLGERKIEVSITHSKEIAGAVAVVYEKEG